MKKMTEHQIVVILKEAEAGIPVKELCRTELNSPPVSGRNYKKALVPTKARKTWAQQLQQNHSVTITMSCAIVGLSRFAYYYQPKLLDDSVMVSVLNAITDQHLR